MKYIIIVFVVLLSSIDAKVIKNPKDVMASYFQDATIVKETVLLTAKKHKISQQLIKTKINSKIFRFFIAKEGSEVVGYGGIITSSVRTKNSTSLVVLNNRGEVKSVEVIAFYEPKEYIPSKRWLNLFNDKSIEDRLKLRSNIPVITGATLSAKTLTDSVNTILAVWNSYYKGK